MSCEHDWYDIDGGMQRACRECGVTEVVVDPLSLRERFGLWLVQRALWVAGPRIRESVLAMIEGGL